MSGPIVRKYGFPNHDAIFGKRDLEHGVDNNAEKPAEASQEEKSKPAEPPKATDKKS